MKKLWVLLLLIILLPPVLAEEYGAEEYEAGYTSLAALGIGLIATGVIYYSMTKRKLIIVHKKSSEWGFEIRPEHPYMTIFGPIYPLTIHHVLTLTGTLLVFIHFFSCDIYTGLTGGTGLAMGIILALLNLNGFIGRYIYRKVLLAAKKHDRKMAKKFVGVLSHWKTVHIALAILFAVLLAIHLATGD